MDLNKLNSRSSASTSNGTGRPISSFRTKSSLASYLSSRHFFNCRRVIYLVGLTSLFAWAALQRFTLPPWPFADPDTWGYLRPAVSSLSGGSFAHTGGRNFLYPGFLFLILAATKNFAAITIVQHSLGLGTGALLLYCWNKVGRHLRAIPHSLHSFLGLGVATVYLLSNRPIFFEHELRPESITPFFALLNILLTLIFLERHQSEGLSDRVTCIAALLLVNSILLATLKTSFSLTVLFSIVPVLCALTNRRDNWQRRAAVLGIGFAAITAVAVPEHELAKSDPAAHSFMAESLFSIHANLILRQIDEDLARGQCGPHGCLWLGEFARSLQEEMTKSWAHDQRYKSFGFNPDYLMYHHDSLSSLTTRLFGADYEKQLDFYRYYYWRTLGQHPERMFGKIVSNMAIFYTWDNPALALNGALPLASLYERAVSSLAAREAEVSTSPPFASYLANCRSFSSSKETIKPIWTIRFLQTMLSHLYLAVLIGVVGVSLILPFSPRWREEYGGFCLIALFLFSYNFGNCLGTAIVHSLHVMRYSVAQYSFTLLSTCVGLLLLVDCAFYLLRRYARFEW